MRRCVFATAQQKSSDGPRCARTQCAMTAATSTANWVPVVFGIVGAVIGAWLVADVARR